MSAPRNAEEQRIDDEFRDKLLGPECFCGSQWRADECAPLKCLAHGYCEALLTPVAAQMTEIDKARIARRCGFDLNKVLA